MKRKGRKKKQSDNEYSLTSPKWQRVFIGITKITVIILDINRYYIMLENLEWA